MVLVAGVRPFQGFGDEAFVRLHLKQMKRSPNYGNRKPETLNLKPTEGP